MSGFHKSCEIKVIVMPAPAVPRRVVPATTSVPLKSSRQCRRAASARKQVEESRMSELEKIELLPPCPMCSGASRLKEVLPHRDGLHYFFKCLVCAVEYPVIEADKSVPRVQGRG
jgi:hypothetical protein